jgi:hypothetical protein
LVQPEQGDEVVSDLDGVGAVVGDVHLHLLAGLAHEAVDDVRRRLELGGGVAGHRRLHHRHLLDLPGDPLEVFEGDGGAERLVDLVAALLARGRRPPGPVILAEGAALRALGGLGEVGGGHEKV